MVADRGRLFCWKPDPFGTFETPLDGQTISGDILLSGWVMDDNTGVQVRIYRLQGAALVYIGNAYILKSLRPDITAAYPEPDYYGGGWRFHLLTCFLPSGGNGTYILEVHASDGAGNIVFLGQNYPNPFNPHTEIRYSLPAPAHVSMTIYNINGKKVLTLKQGHEDAGEHRAMWNGTDQYREQVPSGIYICRMKADGAEKTIRMLLMK